MTKAESCKTVFGLYCNINIILTFVPQIGGQTSDVRRVNPHDPINIIKYPDHACP